MSHHSCDEKIEMVGTINVDNAVSRRHSHTHLHLKPTAVFDHIKTKVRRKSKRFTNHDLSEIPAFATNNSLYGNNIPERSSEESNELQIKKPLTATRSQPIIHTQKLPDRSSVRSNEERITIEKDENNINVPDQIIKDNDINEPVRWRLNSAEVHIDNINNQNQTRSKSTLNRLTKTLSESNTKKQRQTVRHKGFQIRDEDFNNIFNDLPSNEQLIIAYPCGWRKDIFMHGRMFLSVNHLCFYTCFFKWEEKLCIDYKDIISVTRDKSAKVIPNGIQLRTKNHEQYLFASYTPRERIFIAIFRLWQNALLEKPLDYQQLRTIIYADQMSIDESTGDSEESVVLENNGEKSSDQSLRSQSLPPIPSESPTTFINQEQSTYVLTCPCESHLTRTYADRIFPYHVDKLFELTYGDNSFTRTYHDSQKLTDYTIGEWRTNNETGKQERTVTYKTLTQSVFGSNTISCNEKQTMEAEKPHSMYVISTEVFNEGMRYTDAFFVATRFCMIQRDAKSSSLRITAEVRYVKSVNGIAKSFIEKNCHSSIEDGINNLIRRLDNHQSVISNHKSHRKQRSSSKQSLQKKEDDSTNPNEQKDISTLNNLVVSPNQTKITEKTITGKGFFFDILLFIGVILFFLHIHLCYKLYSIDQVLNNSDRTCLNECKQACLSNKLYP